MNGFIDEDEVGTDCGGADCETCNCNEDVCNRQFGLGVYSDGICNDTAHEVDKCHPCSTFYEDFEVF